MRWWDIFLPGPILFPWLPLIYVLAMGAVLVNMFWTKAIESVIAVGFILVGALVYGIFFGGRRLPREV